MADRTQPWGDRTVHVPPADPWAATAPPTVRHDDGPSWPDAGPPPWLGPGAPPPPAYQRGVAQVGQSGTGKRAFRPDDTHAGGPSWPPTAEGPAVGEQPRPPVRYQLRRLRRGGEWTTIGGLFAFVCWGIWVVSIRGGDLTTPILAFVFVLLVALGVFALARLLGRVVVERGLNRTRRSAWPSHLLTGLFLAAAGVAYLKQTQWVVDFWNWLMSHL